MEHKFNSDNEKLLFDSYAIRGHAGEALSNPSLKIPPGYAGRTSWLAAEEAIDDWCDVSVLN